MILSGEPYVTLMASLPAIGFLSEKAPPINAARLAERLRMLSEPDAAEMAAIRSILGWAHIDIGDDDAAFLERLARVLAQVRSPVLRAALDERMEIRTVIAALRRRHAGLEAPAPGERWGWGRHLGHIRANWGLPEFGLARVYPWLPAARERLAKGDSAGLERLVLEAAWRSIDRHAFGHEFDFEAAALYLARWSLADRWSRYDAEAAAGRFAEMLEAA